jgi:DNA-nicking Smr family endonuclease
MAKADDPDDEDLFAQAMQDVAPISKGRAQIGKTGVEVTEAHLQRRDAALGLNDNRVDPNFLTLGEVKPRQPIEYLEWKKVGVQNAVFDRLRRGGYAIEASLDLHRKTVKEARTLVFNFLQMASAKDQRNLLISPGKGEFSKTPGRLKSYVAHWLEQHPEVMAFCSAQKQHGGVGAVYVMVRKSPASRELNREQHGQKSDL